MGYWTETLHAVIAIQLPQRAHAASISSQLQETHVHPHHISHLCHPKQSSPRLPKKDRCRRRVIGFNRQRA